MLGTHLGKQRCQENFSTPLSSQCSAAAKNAKVLYGHPW